ncbi:peptidase inhibitor family I36 protein [Streptomyces aurantiacus]|uniref:Peptidase inhibitor family I36 n=1 Tax=Streptomyces aurantiacus TaxID=47760 RepID=A0A7G1NSI3_9ACTN|nr:peptidase inhibitor family I36 protein [Streptomyces aurantiacus]BCL26188.1 hypothetical protein GCM10017557_10470 [Streptomyces aurantiacus]
MRSRTLSVAFGTAIMMGGAIFGAAPAQAAGCPADSLCLYNDTDYEGIEYDFRSRLGCITLNAVLNGQANDRASSLYNNTGLVQRLYQDYEEGGKYIKISPGQAYADLRSIGIWNADHSYAGVNTFNDRISSFCGSNS